MRDALDEEQQLALEVIRRLEGAEPLSRILPAARRLAETWGQAPAAFWLYMEEVGAQTARMPYAEMSEDQRRGWRRFMGLRESIDVEAVAKTLRPELRKKWDERDHIVTASVAELERAERPAPLKPPVYDENLARGWAMAELSYKEGRRVLDLIRTEAHRFATSLLGLIRENALKISIFGPEVFTVFQAAGPMLAELNSAPETLRREGPYLAAQQARTTVLRMNKALYTGPKEHTSPFNGKTYTTDLAALSRLRAFLDDLWLNAQDPKRRDLLVAAMDELEEAYQLGSKAKDATQITYEEALKTLKLTFNVARTIMLCGGFPVPTDRAEGATETLAPAESSS